MGREGSRDLGERERLVSGRQGSYNDVYIIHKSIIVYEGRNENRRASHIGKIDHHQVKMRSDYW